MADSGGRDNQTSRSNQRFNSTPHGLKRDDTEAEIDSNLDQVSAGLSRIKMMGQAMNQEIEAQSTQINNIQDKTSMVDGRVKNSTGRLNKLLDKKK
jgi:synaptosomal-associated protein 29